MNEKKITWIASYPKSGNTWVRSLITAYMNNGNLDINQIMRTNDKMPFYYEGILDQSISEWGIIEQALIKPVAMLKMLKESNKNLILKTHDCNMAVSGISQIPMDITLSCIYIVRDPRDIALSIKNHYGLKNNQDAVVKLLDENNMNIAKNEGLLSLHLSWKVHINSWVRELPYPVLIVKYENLLEKPVETFGQIIKFLNFKYDKSLIEKSIDSCSFKNMQKQEINHGFKESVGKQFFHKGKAKRWKTELEPELQKKITTAFSKEMKKLGYL